MSAQYEMVFNKDTGVLAFTSNSPNGLIMDNKQGIFYLGSHEFKITDSIKWNSEWDIDNIITQITTSNPDIKAYNGSMKCEFDGRWIMGNITEEVSEYSGCRYYKFENIILVIEGGRLYISCVINTPPLSRWGKKQYPLAFYGLYDKKCAKYIEFVNLIKDTIIDLYLS